MRKVPQVGVERKVRGEALPVKTTLRRVVVALGSLLAVAVAGGAHWKIP